MGCCWKITLIPLLLFLKLELNGQSVHKEQELERIMESLFPVQDDDINYEELYENLSQFYQHPIDLNRTDPEVLLNTYLLSPLQVNQLFHYIDLNGSLISLYELQAIPGFDPHTIQKILPFVTIKEKYFKKNGHPTNKNLTHETKNTVMVRYERTLERKKGYTKPELKSDSTFSSRYLGSEDKLYMRLIMNPSRKVKIGLTTEKDAGEEFIWNPSTRRYGTDFQSFHLAVKDIGKLKHLIIGDYQLQFGQGLVLGAGFSPGKGSETITTVRRADVGARPYTSVVESGHFRGISATFDLGNINFTQSFSLARRDANEQVELDTMASENSFVSSIQVTGFHRTPNEIASKGAIKEKSIASNVNYKSSNDRFLIGLTGIFTSFEVPKIPVERLYNQFEFRGKENFTIGSYYSYSWENMNFFGEAAISKSGGIGIVNGALMNLSRKWELSILIRKFDRNFHTFYGSSFGENSKNINERGIYLGIKYNYSRKLSFTAYFDQFHFPWLKYRVNAPSHGTEVLGRLNFIPSKKISFYGQYRRETKDINSGTETPILKVVPGIKQNYLLNMDFTISNKVSIKSRIQFSNYDKEDEYTRGFVLVQDVNFSVRKFRVSTRVALFDTEDYNNRQYVYERDVLYSFSIPAYYGKGMRQYILLQYNISKNLTAWVRYARTQYKDKDIIGSGLEEISGNKKTDVKVQLRYKF